MKSNDPADFFMDKVTLLPNLQVCFLQGGESILSQSLRGCILQQASTEGQPNCLWLQLLSKLTDDQVLDLQL